MPLVITDETLKALKEMLDAGWGITVNSYTFGKKMHKDCDIAEYHQCEDGYCPYHNCCERFTKGSEVK